MIVSMFDRDVKVLDEADRLLSTDNQEQLMKIYRRLPLHGVGDRRMQVGPTLKLSERLRWKCCRVCHMASRQPLFTYRGADPLTETLTRVSCFPKRRFLDIS